MKMLGKAKGLRPEGLLAIVVACATYERHGLELVVTSCVRPPKAGSLHDEGLAVDLRLPSRCAVLRATGPHPWPADDEVAEELRRDLGSEYDVILERGVPGGDHIHVEFDPKP